MARVTTRPEPATHADVDALEAHVAAAGLPTVGLPAAIGGALVVRDGDGIAASAAVEPYGRDALLRSVAVRAELRGTGLGEALVREAVALAVSRGHRRLYLLTETAAAWFPRFGFRRIDRRDLPPAVATSPEAAEACSDTAAVMLLELPEPR